jgi:hypothetical protein
MGLKMVLIVNINFSLAFHFSFMITFKEVRNQVMLDVRCYLQKPTHFREHLQSPTTVVKLTPHPIVGEGSVGVKFV